MGLPLESVLRLSGDEMRIWNHELARRPPEAVEFLLAQIWLLIAKGLGGDKARDLEVYDVAPWLDSQAAKAERARRAEDGILAAVAASIGAVNGA